MKTCICQKCEKKFLKYPSQIKLGRGKYCSKKCFNSGRQTKVEKVCPVCQMSFFVHPSTLQRGYGKYCSKSCFGTKMLGIQNPWWKGGTTSEREHLMKRKEYILWRKSIFTRDNYTCQECGIRGGKLEADHIKPWALYPELRYILENGRTLCIPCHKKIGWSLFKENNPMKSAYTKTGKWN